MASSNEQGIKTPLFGGTLYCCATLLFSCGASLLVVLLEKKEADARGVVIQSVLAYGFLWLHQRQKREVYRWPTWHHYFWNYVPCAVCTGFDVGFSNVAMQQMSVTTGIFTLALISSHHQKADIMM